MKICTECEFCEEKAIQDRAGNIGTIYLCMHSECRDVIEGRPAPAIDCRRADVYCGFNAKYYKKKEQKDTVVSLLKA